MRYTAGLLGSRVTTARRFVPAGAFDKQIRKSNRPPAWDPGPASRAWRLPECL
ncbi:hypothetical protein [Streptomyces canus]|uniref:hypothetical protein n=1 Tax=Streptomyces canus TaxID=58343 RepID=UPI00371B87F8